MLSFCFFIEKMGRGETETQSGLFFLFFVKPVIVHTSSFPSLRQCCPDVTDGAYLSISQWIRFSREMSLNGNH